MDRRTFIRTAASSAVSACLLGGMTDNALHAHAAPLPATAHSGDFVATADGAKLAYADWGHGRPVGNTRDGCRLPFPRASSAARPF
jgi:hypothetical protein